VTYIFLGLQVKQQPTGIFISQSKYVSDILLKFGFKDVKAASTAMETRKSLSADLEGGISMFICKDP